MCIVWHWWVTFLHVVSMIYTSNLHFYKGQIYAMFWTRCYRISVIAFYIFCVILDGLIGLMWIETNQRCCILNHQHRFSTISQCNYIYSLNFYQCRQFTGLGSPDNCQLGAKSAWFTWVNLVIWVTVDKSVPSIHVQEHCGVSPCWFPDPARSSASQST